MHSIPRFWRNIKSRYNLVGTQCVTCGNKYFPPRNICPTCRRDSQIEKIKFKGEGSIETFTVIHTSPTDFDAQSPYIMAIVKLDEGPMLTTQIVDCELEDVEIGLKVENVFRKIQQDGEAGLVYYGFKFRPKM